MPATDSRQSQKEVRRARVVETAMLMARDGGYDAVQMRDVSAEANVALGTIYRYFSSKDQLLIEGLAEWVAIVRREIERRPPAEPEPVDRLVAVMRRATARTDNQPVLMKALITALASTDPSTVEPRRRVQEEVSAIVRDAIGESDTIDVEGVRRVLGHVWFSALIAWVSGQLPTGGVGDELEAAARMLLGSPDGPDTPAATS